MEQVINLEPGEDVASLRARLARLDGDTVVVIILSGAEVLRSPIATRLLRRQAEALGKHLEVVCDDRRTLDTLRSEGIPNCTLGEYQQRLLDTADAEGEARAARLPRRSRGHSRVLQGAFVVLLLALVAGYLLLPSASVVIILASDTVWENIEVTAALGAESIDVVQQQIPGRRLEATFEGRGRISPSGKKVSPAAPAKGEVYFVNLSGAALVVPKGTRVGTASGIWFRTAEAVTLPLQPQATVTASITAEEPGAAGNVPAMNIDRLWGGALVGQMRVFNPQATTGGVDKESPELTAADRETLRRQVLVEVWRQALAEFQRWDGGSYFVYPEALKTEILEERLEPIASDGDGSQEMRLRVQARVIAFHVANAQRLALELFRQRDAGRFIISPDITVLPAELTAQDDDTVAFQLYTERQQTALPDLGRLRQELAGMSQDKAAAHLATGVALARPAWIEVHPSWMARLPRFPWRIDIRVATAQ